MDFQKSYLSLKYYALGRNYFYVLKALNFAKKYHNGLRKDNITPEIQHQYEICLYISTLKNLIDEELCLTGAILHDILEDYNIEKSQILNLFGSSKQDLEFGEKVLDIVWRLTKVYKGVKKSPVEYFQSISECPYSSIIKGCDRIHNIQSMAGVFSFEKMESYLDEAKTYFLPMIKTAKGNYAEQSSAYFNIQQVMKNQISMLDFFIELRKKEVINK